jgi:hypothetical protein
MAGMLGCNDRNIPYEEYIARYWRNNIKFRDLIRASVEDIRAGRITPWPAVQRELREEEKP